LGAKLSLTLATLVILAGVSEVATRCFTDTVAPVIISDPVLGRRYTPNFRGMIQTDEREARTHISINREGLRDKDWSLDKASDVRGIAVLGDSMVVAIATDEEDTMVRLLEKKLNGTHDSVTWETMNFGVSSFSTGQELVMYRNVVAKYNPDIVLCVFCTRNDLADNCHRLSNARRIYFDLDEQGELVQLPFSVPRANLSGWLNRNSRFYVWQKVAMQRTVNRGARMTGVLKAGKWIFCEEHSDKLARAWTITEKLVATMKREVEANGARFAVVLLPAADQFVDEFWQTDVQEAGELGPQMNRDHPQQQMQAICDKHEIPLVVMADRFRAVARHSSIKYEDEWLFYHGRGTSTSWATDSRPRRYMNSSSREGGKKVSVAWRRQVPAQGPYHRPERRHRSEKLGRDPIRSRRSPGLHRRQIAL